MDNAHPSATAVAGLELAGLRATHPSPGRVTDVLALVGEKLDVHQGPALALEATLRTPAGEVVR